MPRKPQENPTIVINPDHDVCICCQIDETQPSTSESSETESSDAFISEGDSSEYDLDSDTESLDPEVLAFLYKKSPMLALADRTWSEEIAGKANTAHLSLNTLVQVQAKSGQKGMHLTMMGGPVLDVYVHGERRAPLKVNRLNF